jgi:hypothetical protein
MAPEGRAGVCVEHHLVLVPHTHWDREWYRTHEEFRYRLVRLLDGLLDLLEGDPAFRHFTLDGQTIVVDDYLEVRPEARERIEALVRAGRLLVGPWYVLPDEWLVSGEALIRNLRLGLTRAAELGGCMRLGYVPDQFGHVGQLPQILAGFGLEGAALWRGVGPELDRTLFRWVAPDGTDLLTVYLIQGYGNAAQLPLDPVELAHRLEAAAAALAPHSSIPSLLLMNGSDHLEPDPGLPAALAAAARHLSAGVEIGTLPGFFARARGEAPEDLPRHRGELRSGHRAPLLEGCASARLPQKQADFRNDRLLTRYLEPLAAWLGALGGDPDPGVLEHAWRLALQNHPHDSICGCSIDAVHTEMDLRFARVMQVGEAHLRRVSGDLSRRVRVPSRGFGRAAGACLIAWNPHAGGHVQGEGMLELEAPAVGGSRPALHLRAGDGRRVPVQAERVAPGADLAEYRLPAGVVATLVLGFPGEFMGLHACGVDLRRVGPEPGVEILLGSEQPQGFDFEAARRQVAQQLAEEGERSVQYRVRRLPRVRLRFVDELPGCGLRVYRVARGRVGRPGSLVAECGADGNLRLANASWEVEAAPDGSLQLRHLDTGVRIGDALRLVSEGDRGDEYGFDPVPGALVVERPERVRVGLGPASEAEASLVIDARYRVPAALRAGRASRERRSVALPVRIEVRLWEGLDRVDVDLEVDNPARDHRLRAHIRAPFAAQAFEVESAFEVAARPIAPEPDASSGAGPAELPTGATPQRAFATVHDQALALTVANRGCAEVEAVPEADGCTSLAVTVLRAVGWLSRDDLARRPGHAGPALPTPGAQVPGPHRCELSLRLHRVDDFSRTVEAHRFATPALLFRGAGSGAGPLADAARLLEVDDPRIVVTAIEPDRAGGALVRLYNASPETRELRVRWGGGEGGRLRAVDLAGRPDTGLPVTEQPDGAIRLRLRPWQIAGLRTG